MSKAAIAVRVSPRPQENVRYSPEIQEQKCREWAAREGHEVVAVVQDILVSGGSADRFDSIFAAMEQHRPDLFIVSDLSRWTRDRPSRFWAIKALLEDRGVQLVSVDEPWLGSETPFSDTVTTATVEMNYQERLRLKAKTSAGVRKAWASGKRWGRIFGWTWHPREAHAHDGQACSTFGTFTQDVERIRSLYLDSLSMPIYELAVKYGLRASNVGYTLAAVSQREIVGRELWERAQRGRPRGRAGRRDASKSNIYRGLLPCPFCGAMMQQAPHWGHYRCPKRLVPHGWFSISAPKWVTPEVARALARLEVPDALSLETAVEQHTPRVRDYQSEIERLTMAWVKGRLSEDRYEKALAAIEQERQTAEKLTAPPPEEVVSVVRSLSVIDLDCREPESGNLANRLLHGIIERIDIAPDRTAKVILRPEVEAWGFLSA